VVQFRIQSNAVVSLLVISKEICSAIPSFDWQAEAPTGPLKQKLGSP
jgi:hypothetical protein